MTGAFWSKDEQKVGACRETLDYLGNHRRIDSRWYHLPGMVADCNRNFFLEGGYQSMIDLSPKGIKNIIDRAIYWTGVGMALTLGNWLYWKILKKLLTLF